MWGPFSNKSGVIQVEKMCGRITMCKCTKSYNKTTYFYLKTKLHRKENVGNFRLHSMIFFTQFGLCSQIFKIWELFFQSA